MDSSSRKLNKRDKIIIGAISLFRHTHDFRRVSIEAIAREAHVSPTTIYNNFSNRETLVYEVIKHLARANIEQNRALIHSHLPFPKKLISIIRGKLNMDEKVNHEIIEKLISQDNRIVPFIDEIFQQEIKPLWREIVADGKKQGYIDPTLDDEIILIYLDVMQAGFKDKPELLKGFKDNPGFIEQLIHLMYYGFLIKEFDFSRMGERRRRNES